MTRMCSNSRETRTCRVRDAGGCSSAPTRLAPRPIVEALERGDFYASTGVELTDYQVTARAMTITIKQRPESKYRVQFIGRNGQVLSDVASSPAEYAFRGDELYVRAKILESNGTVAWTQPAWRGASAVR